VKRKSYGRDFGLSVRMVFTGGLLGLLYVIFALVLFQVLNVGLAPMLVIIVGIAAVQYYTSDKLALAASGAKVVSREEAPDLHAMVERLCALADLPMPRVAVIPTDVPNAFATGRNPKHAAVAVTVGLLRHMPENQVRGVLAHEFAHIKNRDILVSSIAAALGAIITGIAYALQFGMLFGGGDDDDGPLGIVGALAMIILAPLAATILQLAVSRQREYLADASGASYLGDPNPLADALETLERGTQLIPLQVNPSVASLYIANPLSKQGLSGLFSTHPPLEERIRRLRALSAF
jgi:heat shock protein HtpX